MTQQTRSRRPGLWMLAVLVLVLALALAACGGRARQGGGTNGAASNNTSQQYNSSGSANSGSNSSTVSDLSNADQQIQSAIQTMNGASNDAGADYSSQSNNDVP